MIDYNTELAEMVCTRISHDLIGNIGALSSVLELINEGENVLDDDTKGILQTATDTLKARQSFFRVAFGLNTKNIELSQLQKLCQDYLKTVGSRSTPMTVRFSGISEELAKFVCLSVMTAAEVCIRGGDINIVVNKNNMIIKVSSEHNLSAAKIAVYREILAGKLPEDNVSQYVQLIYLRELLGNDVTMKIEADANEMQLVIG